MTTAEASAGAALYRLLAWLSPNFPTGAFSYSHGLETAVAEGAVRDRASLEAWVAAIVAHGSGRMDADIVRDAYRAAERDDKAGLATANRHGLAFRPTAELALEAAQQGDAFVRTYQAAWAEHPHPTPPPHVGEGWRGGSEVCHSAAFGAAAAAAGIALEDALVGYLQSFASNLIAAGLRLGVVGQNDGQRILAALAPIVAAAASAALSRADDDFGSATFAADLLSMRHETLYTRLFRS